MATVEIRQGDSYAIFLDLEQDGKILTDAMVDDLEICIGEVARYSYQEGSVFYASQSARWYFWPSQKETFGMEEGTYFPEIRVKYKNQSKTNVKGFKLNDKIKVLGATSREVL